MGFIIRNDEQIRVGATPGLIAGSSSFIFDGTLGKPNYINFDIIISESNGRSPLIKGFDYNWNSDTGLFSLITPGDVLQANQWYNVRFQPLAQPLTFNYSSLINSSFFVRDIYIPNTNNLPTLAKINLFIQKHESECLNKILGYKMYSILKTEPSSRVNDLVYGTGFHSPSNFERYWNGIVHDTDISLIANYVYYQILKSDASQNSGRGVKISKHESGEGFSSADKMVSAWKFFASETREMCCFLWNKRVGDVTTGDRVYPEFTPNNWNCTMNYARKSGVNLFGF